MSDQIYLVEVYDYLNIRLDVHTMLRLLSSFEAMFIYFMCIAKVFVYFNLLDSLMFSLSSLCFSLKWRCDNTLFNTLCLTVSDCEEGLFLM